MKSNVKLHFNPDSLKISGQEPLINTSFDFTVPGCSTSSNRGGGLGVMEVETFKLYHRPGQ